LARDRADRSPGDLRRIVCRAMRSTEDRLQDGKTLGRDLDTVLAKKISWFCGRLRGHGYIICPTSDGVKFCSVAILS
jgi:hypothetical protein